MGLKLEDVNPREYEHVEIGSEGCCPKNFQNRCPPTIHDDAEVIFVGEAPGETEVEEQEGFVGRSGKLLRSTAHTYGITNYSLTNVVKCRPEGNATPTQKMIRCCMNNTADEVRGHKWVVLVGNTACKAFFPDGNPKSLRGNAALHPDYPDQRFYTIYHPAWALRKGNEGRETFRQQIARLGRMIEDDGPNMTVVRSDNNEFFGRLEDHLSRGKISLDIETTHLESWKIHSRIKSVALTGDGEEVIFWHEDEPVWTGAMHRLQDYLEEPHKKVIGHHIGFDLEWIERKMDFSVQCRRILDTGVLWYFALDYRMPSLKELTSDLLDGYRYLVTNPDEYDDVENLGKYNAEDVIYPWKLFKKGVKRLDPDQLDLYLRMFGPSDLFLQRITANGFHFDVEHWDRLQRELESERNEIIGTWRDEDPDFNPEILNSTKALKRYLFETKDLPVIDETDTGQPKTDKDTLRKLRDNHGAGFVDYLLKYRSVNKEDTTFVSGISDKVEQDNRIHADYLNSVTDSGRFSSRRPNCQNIPRAARIRKQFGSQTGSTLLEADYSQIELRVMLCLAGQQDAIEAYRQGVDAHMQTAMDMTGKDDPSDVTKKERTKAKPVNFGLLYGGGPYTLQRQAKSYGMDWSIDRCDRFVRFFFDKYDRLPEYHQDVVTRLYENGGMVPDVMGFKHRYKKWDPHPSWKYSGEVPDEEDWGHWERSAINAMGQGPASFITAYLGIIAQRRIRADDLYPAVKTVNTVHDSVIFEVQDDKVQHVVDHLTEANRVVADWIGNWFKVPLVLDFERGPSWGELDEMNYTAVA